MTVVHNELTTVAQVGEWVNAPFAASYQITSRIESDATVTFLTRSNTGELETYVIEK